MLFKKTLIIGLGLIGGSFAKALRQAKISGEIFACDIDFDAGSLAKNDGVIDGAFAELEFFSDEISSFDFIVVATPLSTYDEIFKKISGKISPDAILIDLGSLKKINAKKFLSSKAASNFIPCHPIAGAEVSGYENSSADLFLGKKFIICPENTNENSVKKVAEVARKIGSEVEFLSAEKHDEIYALVSHLPQFLSFLTKEFSPKNIKDEFFQTAFRLDNSSPEIWSDIFKMNERNIEKFYMQFFSNLEKIIATPAVILESEGLEDPVNLEEKAKLTRSSTLRVKDDGRGGGFDEKFFEENFAVIFFRALVVESFLKIPQIKNWKTYGGSGFKDFTSILEIRNYDAKKLAGLIEKNRQKILKIFHSIS